MRWCGAGATSAFSTDAFDCRPPARLIRPQRRVQAIARDRRSCPIDPEFNAVENIAVTISAQEANVNSVSKRILLCIFLTPSALWLSRPASAFDCAKATLGIDFVICSSSDILAANQVHETAYFALRERLGETERNKLLESQRQWLREIPSECRIPARGRPAAISRDSQQCVMQALTARTNFLQHYAGGPTGASPSSPQMAGAAPGIAAAAMPPAAPVRSQGDDKGIWSKDCSSPVSSAHCLA